MSKVRHRRKKSEMPFADALSAATKRLTRATKEREQAQKNLTSLNAEIPNLQRTIQALQVQLKGSVAVVRAIPPREGEETFIGVAPLGIPSPVIPEGVTLPAEDLSGMGSTRAVDEDVLPDAEGESLIEE